MATEEDSSASTRVRAFCATQYVTPARQRGDYSVTIRAGDVHRKLDFRNRLPLVCSALGSNRFEDELDLKRVSIDGPLNGANTYFTYLFRENLTRTGG